MCAAASCKEILPLLAQAFLSEFMSSKLQLEENDDLTKKSTTALDKSHPATKSYNNFDGNTKIICQYGGVTINNTK